MIDKGEKLPKFSIPDQNGTLFNSELLLGKNAVIFFYPKDDTPVCTIEACSFRNEYDQFNELNAEVLGISSDTPESHQQFIKKHGLNYNLLSDIDDHTAALFGLEKQLFGLLRPRVTFVFDKNGLLLKSIGSRWNGKAHMKEALEVLQNQ